MASNIEKIFISPYVHPCVYLPFSALVKGSRKNNFTFSHPIFRSSLAAPQSQVSEFASLRDSEYNLNLGANSGNLFLREP